MCGIAGIHLLRGEIKESPEKIIQDFNNLIQKLDERINKFTILTGALVKLASILQEENMTFQGVKQFHTRSEVKNTVEQLEKCYNEELKRIPTSIS